MFRKERVDTTKKKCSLDSSCSDESYKEHNSFVHSHSFIQPHSFIRGSKVVLFLLIARYVHYWLLNTNYRIHFITNAHLAASINQWQEFGGDIDKLATGAISGGWRCPPRHPLTLLWGFGPLEARTLRGTKLAYERWKMNKKHNFKSICHVFLYNMCLKCKKVDVN